MSDQRLLYDVVANLPTGNLALQSIQVNHWGSEVIFHFIYRYPPQERLFQVTLSGCRGIEWYILKIADTIPDGAEAQLLSHDLGADNYQRTARIATTLAEVIISYKQLSVIETPM